MSEKDAKSLALTVKWRTDEMVRAKESLVNAERAYRETQWKYEEALDALTGFVNKADVARSAGETESLTSE